MILSRPEIDLRQLHAFLILAEELHFGRAAARFGIAQPPLSQQIQRLERRIGYRLLVRGGAAWLALTPAGRAMLPAARQAIAELEAGLGAAPLNHNAKVRIVADVVVCKLYGLSAGVTTDPCIVQRGEGTQGPGRLGSPVSLRGSLPSPAPDAERSFARSARNRHWARA